MLPGSPSGEPANLSDLLVRGLVDSNVSGEDWLELAVFGNSTRRLPPLPTHNAASFDTPLAEGFQLIRIASLDAALTKHPDVIRAE